MGNSRSSVLQFAIRMSTHPAAGGPAVAPTTVLNRWLAIWMRSFATAQWLRRHVNDRFVKRANSLGLRSRAACKLEDIDDKLRVLQPGASVVDLGCSPGGWSQIAAPRVQSEVSWSSFTLHADEAPVATPAVPKAGSVFGASARDMAKLVVKPLHAASEPSTPPSSDPEALNHNAAKSDFHLRESQIKTVHPLPVGATNGCIIGIDLVEMSPVR